MVCGLSVFVPSSLPLPRNFARVRANLGWGGRVSEIKRSKSNYSIWYLAIHLHRRFRLLLLSQQSTVGGSAVLKLKHWWRDVEKSLGMMAQKILGYFFSFHCSKDMSSVFVPSSLPLPRMDDPVLLWQLFSFPGFLCLFVDAAASFRHCLAYYAPSLIDLANNIRLE